MIADDAGMVSLGGGEVEFKRFGPAPADGPTIVLLHEGLGCVDLWKDFPARLQRATGYGVFVYSRFGYGRSSPAGLPRPLTYMHDEAQAVLPELLDAIGFRNGVLFGHSDGASIAAIYAGHARDPRVRGLILMAPHFFNEPMNVESISRAVKAYEAGGLKAGLEKYHGANTDCAFYGWSGAWLDPGFLEWNIEEFIPGIQVPTLVIQGRDDEYGSLKHVEAVETGCTGPFAKKILEACGHSPHRDQPELVLAEISGFLADLKFA